MNEIDYEPLHALLEELSGLLGDIFLSGCASVGETTVGDMRRLRSLCEDYGLTSAAEKLGELHELIENRRHGDRQRDGDICSALGWLDGYIRAAARQLEKDMAIRSLTKNTGGAQ